MDQTSPPSVKMSPIKTRSRVWDMPWYHFWMLRKNLSSEFDEVVDWRSYPVVMYRDGSRGFWPVGSQPRRKQAYPKRRKLEPVPEESTNV